MVLSYEQVAAMLDEIADSFPEELFRELNGAVLLLPDEKHHPDAEDLNVMGVYCHDALGCHIELYYGSFLQMAQQEDWSEEDWREELWLTLSHELTHHLESLAGERSLEEKDEAFMEDYWQAQGQGEPRRRRPRPQQEP